MSYFRRFYAAHETISRIRNIGIIAHIDAGKTTTTERMLFYSGMTKNIGIVDHGNTVTDFMRQEKERGITIASASITFGWNEHRINLIDTPGHIDFTVEVERAMRVLDGAVTIVDAVAGVEAQTQTVWKQAEKYNIPQIVFINKMDRLGANFNQTVKSIQKSLSQNAIPFQYPILNSDQQLIGIVNLLESTYVEWIDEEGIRMRETNIEESQECQSVLKQINALRFIILERLATENEEILESFVKNDNFDHVPQQTIIKAARDLVVQQKLVPIYCGASLKNIGVQCVMDSIVKYLPSPNEKTFPCIVDSLQEEALEKAKKRDDFLAIAFKVVVDSNKGPMVFIRVYSGSVTPCTIFNTTRNTKERIQKIFQVYADEYEAVDSVSTGNICLLIGPKGIKTGDTLCAVNSVFKGQFKSMDLFQPVFYCSVEPDSVSDEKILLAELKNLELEDPSVVVDINEITGQITVKGMGELHLEIIQDRLIHEKNVKARFSPVQISYREAVSTSYVAQVSLNKKVGSKSFLAHMEYKVEPCDNFECDLQVKIESPDSEHIKSLMAESIQCGPLSGHPLCYTRFILTKLDMPNQNPESLNYCISQSMLECQMQGTYNLCEPIMQCVVSTPNVYVGAIVQDISAMRKGKVERIDSDDQKSLVHALIPLKSILGYSSALRSISQGYASFSMQFHSYKRVQTKMEVSE